MFRLPPWIVVTAVWAAIYLPALGSFEIKSEEGRRILPAMAMLESGNYLAPQIGSDTYFSKPPLVNWLVAASFKLFGTRSEWAARVPSVLAVLAVAFAFITVGRTGLGTRGATMGALLWLAIFGIIEKGRLIEIEAVYVSLCGIAIICWISWWLGRRSPWLTWTVPWVWLGLGWLAKGPVHLIFFYAVVCAILWQTRKLKALLHPAHLVGVLIMLGIFAVWAIPFLQVAGQSRGLTKWSAQFTGRVSPQLLNVRSSLFTLVRAIGQLLPWVIFLPLIRIVRFDETEDKQIGRALIWGVSVPLVLVSVLPVSAPRYSLPAAAPFAWLMGLAFARDAFAPLGWARKPHHTMWRRFGQPLVLVIALAALIGFPVWSHVSGKRQKVKNIAAEVNARVPRTETLYALDPGYQPFLFYVGARVQSADRLEQIPAKAQYVVVRPARAGEVERCEQWSPRHPRLVARLIDYRKETILLYQITGD